MKEGMRMVLGWLKKIFEKGKPIIKMESDSASPDYDPIPPIEGKEETVTIPRESESAELEPVLETPGENLSHTKSEILLTMEAALFMATKGMSVEELGKITNTSLLQTRSYVSQLVDEFNERDSALEIVEDVGGFRMHVRSPYDNKVSHLAGVSELSPGELKTLAFIAYKQPLIQSQLVQVRSNTAYDQLHTLVEKGFVAREPKGRTYILRTTKKFSEYFGAHALKLKPMKPGSQTPSPTESTA